MKVAKSILVTGGILAAVLSAIVLVSLWHEPRIWLHDMPQSFQDRTTPKTDREVMLTWMYGLAFIPLFFVVPIVSSVRLLRRNPELGVWSAVLNAAGIMLIFGIVDLILIDWLLICLLTPPFVVMAGTEGATEYHDYWFHTVGFFVGFPMMAVAGLVAGLIAVRMRDAHA